MLSVNSISFIPSFIIDMHNNLSIVILFLYILYKQFYNYIIHTYKLFHFE